MFGLFQHTKEDNLLFGTFVIINVESLYSLCHINWNIFCQPVGQYVIYLLFMLYTYAGQKFRKI